MRDEWPNKCAARNRRYPFPLGTGWEFVRAFHSPPRLSAAVAGLGG